MILSALSLMIIALVCVEVLSEVQVNGLSDAVNYHQEVLERAQHQQELLRSMLQKLAVASISDPALADLLHDHGIRVNRRSVQAAPAPAGSKPAPAAPDVPPVAQ